MIYRNRLDNVVKFMKEDGLQQIIVTDDDNFKYLTGMAAFPLERVGVLLIKDTGEVKAFANTIITMIDDGSFEIVRHTDMDDPYTDLAAALDPGKVGIDATWHAKHLINLMEKRPDIVPVEGNGPLIKARLFKDEEELRRLRASSALNDRAIEHMIGLIAEHPDWTEQQFSEEVDKFFSLGGADKNPWFQVVCFGANGADPHHEPDRTSVLKEGDAVLFDLFAPLDDYWCDMTRTVFYKSVSDEHRRAYETVKKAQQTAIDTVRPGVHLTEVHANCVKVLHDAGYEFEGRIGHGVGIGIHEFPSVSPVNDIILEPGMIFTLEPGVYIKGDIGIRIEDVVLVTENGCEPLNHYPKELMIVGA